MHYNTYTVNRVKVHVASDDISNLRLLQTSNNKKYRLSQYFYGDKAPAAIINCSYFASTGVLGRNQGDVKQDTSSWNTQQYLAFAKTDAGYTSGQLEFWDASKSVCGFTPAAVCIENGKDIQNASVGLGLTYSYKMSLATAVTFFGILSDYKTCMFITAGPGLSGYSLLDFLKSKFTFNYLCELDGGGSTEMIVNRQIVQKSTDGSERPMYNGLAFINSTQDDKGKIKELEKELGKYKEAIDDIQEKINTL